MTQPNETTNDIVTELRRPPPHDPLSCTPLRLRAADEIERLRREKRFLFKAGCAAGAFPNCDPDGDVP